MNITQSERNTLRELARRQAEIANLPIMAEREKIWCGLNDGNTEFPLVTMEYHGLPGDIFPPLKCENNFAKSLESQMSRQLFKYEIFKDDRVIPNTVLVDIPNYIKPFDYDVETYAPTSSIGKDTVGYMFTHVVHDLSSDFEILKPSPFEVDTGLKKANKTKELVEDILGDIIPVELNFTPIYYSPGYFLISMMSMETMFCSMLDYPDLFHKIMRNHTDDYHNFIDAMESGGAILPTNGATSICMDTYCYTNDLPKPGEPGREWKISDTWGYTNYQEAEGISPQMFDEFFFSYTKEIADRCGLYSYGCCEAVHTLWEPCLSKLGTLRKLSISHWTDEDAIGEMIRSKKIVYHRKPFPNFIAVDDVFDEEAFLNHIKHSVIAARGCPLEVTFRDVYSFKGEPWRLSRAVELTREAFARWWQR